MGEGVTREQHRSIRLESMQEEVPENPRLDWAKLSLGLASGWWHLEMVQSQTDVRCWLEQVCQDSKKTNFMKNRKKFAFPFCRSDCCMGGCEL